MKRPTHERVEAARLIAARYAGGDTKLSLAEQRVLADGFEALYAIACLGLPNDALAPEVKTSDLFVVETIHDGTDWCVRRATTAEVTKWSMMSYETAASRARTLALRDGCRWFDFSSNPVPEGKT